jgi:hypothetical protein
VLCALEPPRQVLLLDLGRGRRAQQHPHPVDGVEQRDQRPDHQRQLRDRAAGLDGQQMPVACGALQCGRERQQRLARALDQPALPRRGHHLRDRGQHRADQVAALVVGHRAVEDRIGCELGHHRLRVPFEERVREPASW